VASAVIIPNQEEVAKSVTELHTMQKLGCSMIHVLLRPDSYLPARNRGYYR